MITVGVLAFHGDVIEHIRATEEAAANLKANCKVVEIRTSEELRGLKGLVIPGGESTNFYKLCRREGMIEGIKRIPNIFGTCAGAIMLAKKVYNAEEGQRTLGLMDIEIDRNAYGRQSDSFEEDVETKIGRVHAVFIRAPRIKRIGRKVDAIAERNGEVIACEQRSKASCYLATCFHPELSTPKFHEYFLKKLF